MVDTGRDEGLSEVIGFIMILALIMIFLSIWVIYAVPAEGRQQEIEHMDDVQNWFTQYKITADSLWINYDPDEGVGPVDITISNSMVLGSQGGATHSQGLFMVFMRPFGSSGTLSLVNESERIEITDNIAGTVVDQDIVSVQYMASNTYWIPQTYYYQMGGVFLEQSDGTVNRVAPLIKFNPAENSAIIKIININRIQSGTNLISGEGPVRIDTVLTGKTDELTISDDPAIEITLRDNSAAKAWWSILKELGATVDSPAGNTITIDGLDEISYQYMNYTVSLQSVAAAYS
ncbi:MAG: hypothetical protein JW931_03130 [Methanomicrobiaceae archaeon]|nr:hypothetical protein [Methanomicrobiaceae archaeon]